MTRRPVLSGVVLAGGRSGRMGEFKPLLPIDGVPAVVRCAQTFTDIGVEPVAVLGFAAERLAEVLDGVGVRHVTNDGFERGMYSSVLTGVAAVDDDAQWVAILPVDSPLVRAETVGDMVREAAGDDCDVVHPVHGDRRGHPPLFRRIVSAAIMASEPPGGLRDVLAAFDDRALEVRVEDGGVLIDMDDPEDYARVADLARMERVPTPVECRRLLEQWGVPEVVRAHCAAVAGVADDLGRALNKAGVCLNLKLLVAAALLHDARRDQPGHAVAGAAHLTASGFPRVAAMVAHHMDVPQPLAAIPGEGEVLYLADKLVRDITTISLQRRLADALERFAGDEHARSAARHRLEAAMRVAAAVERLTGQPLERLIA